MRTHRPSRHIVAIAVAAVLVLLVGASVTYANWPGSVTNSTNTVNTGSMAWSISAPNGTCTLAVRASAPAMPTPSVPGMAPCRNSITGRGATQTVLTSGNTTALTITNGGNLTSSQVSASLSIPSCGVVKFTNAANPANPMTVRGAPEFNTTDRWGTTSSTYLPSLTQGAAVVQQNTPVGLANGFSFGLWFKIGTALPSASVGLMGLGISPWNVQSTGNTVSPVGLWIDKTGHLRFQLAGLAGAVVTAATANTYLDGAWHYAVVTASTVLLSTTITAWVDNTAPGNTASVSTLNTNLLGGGQGYWHLGWVDSNRAAAADKPTNPSMAGWIAGAFVRNAATSSVEFTALQASASAASYKSAVLGLSSINSVWMADDDGRSTWDGTVPGLGSTLPCDMVSVTWTFSNPAATIAATATNLRNIIGTYNVGVPAPGSPQTSSQTLTRNGNYVTAASRLLLFLPITYTLKSLPSPGWTVPWTWGSSSPITDFYGGGSGLQLS